MGRGLNGLDTAELGAFRHVPALDGLRGLAVCLVLAFHFTAIFNPERGGFFPGGFIGVDIFFVLSGFLITSLLIGEQSKRGTVSFRNFYMRRALRLLPALGLFLVLELLYAQWVHLPVGDNLKAVFSVVFYFSNWAQTYWDTVPFRNGGLALTWSLSIEEQFYLVWPALLLFGILRYARSRNMVLAVLALGVLASAAIRIYLWRWGSGYPAAYMRTDARMDGLLLGALCSFAWRWKLVPNGRWLRVAGMAGFALLAGVALFWPEGSAGMYNGGYTIVSLAAATVLLALLHGGSQLDRIFNFAPLRGAGRISYGLYLFGAVAARVAFREFSDNGKFIVFATGLAMTFAISIASWHFLERPIMQLRKKVAPTPVENLQPEATGIT
ncbi:MAG: hypothetical protein QOF21_1506, partial [Actinomycetota bacterium]